MDISLYVYDIVRVVDPYVEVEEFFATITFRIYVQII